MVFGDFEKPRQRIAYNFGSVAMGDRTGRGSFLPERSCCYRAQFRCDGLILILSPSEADKDCNINLTLRPVGGRADPLFGPTRGTSWSRIEDHTFDHKKLVQQTIDGLRNTQAI